MRSQVRSKVKQVDQLSLVQVHSLGLHHYLLASVRRSEGMLRTVAIRPCPPAFSGKSRSHFRAFFFL